MSKPRTQAQRAKYKKSEFIPVDRIAETKALILIYDPDDDTIEIDAAGLTGIELREMIRMAWNKIFSEEEV